MWFTTNNKFSAPSVYQTSTQTIFADCCIVIAIRFLKHTTNLFEQTFSGNLTVQRIDR